MFSELICWTVSLESGSEYSWVIDSASPSVSNCFPFCLIVCPVVLSFQYVCFLPPGEFRVSVYIWVGPWWVETSTCAEGCIEMWVRAQQLKLYCLLPIPAVLHTSSCCQAVTSGHKNAAFSLSPFWEGLYLWLSSKSLCF